MIKKIFIIILCVVTLTFSTAITGLCASYNVVEYEDNLLANYSVCAMDNVRILGNTIINSGDVGVSGTVMMCQLDSEAELPVQKKVYIDHDVYFEHDTSIYGEYIEIKSGASVDNVYYNELLNEGEIRGEEGLFAEQAPSIIFPDLPEAQPGTENITIYPGENLVLEPGNYGDIRVKTYGTLILTGGTYHMENLDLGYYNTKILILGPTEIVINNQLNSFLKSYIGPDKECDISARDICIYVGGENGGGRYFKYFKDFPKAVQIGRYSDISANIYAPNGTIWVQRSCTVKGAFIGKDVLIGYGVKITLDSAKPPHTITYFADPNLEAAVRDAIDKPQGDLYTSDLERLEALNASGREIEELTGIEDCINLTNLVLSYNNITDISPLAGLLNLVSLNLNENNINDLTPLAGLNNLTRLYLGNNNISDETLYHLSGLTILTTLVLDYNSITDITPLENLSNLTCLVMNDNYIDDITPLEDMTGLIVLYLYNNNIIDLTSLENLTELTTLYLYDNSISDVKPLSGLINLTSLVLDYNQIEDISPLANLKNLSTLYLNENNISDIFPLRGLEKLTTLILDTNRILDITPLAGLKYVSYLNLGVNNIIDITPLEGLTNLSILYLHNNNISKIEALINNCDAGGLGEGDVIYLNYNPLDDEGVQEGISYLSDNGVIMYW